MTLPLETLLIVAMASQMATEHLFGSFLGGYKMKFASLGMGVAMAFVFWVLKLNGMESHSPVATFALGIMAGLGSNYLHGLVNKLASAGNAYPLSGVLHKSKE